ncbi:unnamed protein product [Sphenostylis stenocarpa]|uniref:Uncharacterized protein n=1 Tax=Sphenostylis stenocarpa TaxID=92480 RepID=A0AA86SUS1_9FABA|nr:unnamed protein product [Sphenostylis stenocarpa]
MRKQEIRQSKQLVEMITVKIMKCHHQFSSGHTRKQIASDLKNILKKTMLAKPQHTAATIEEGKSAQTPKQNIGEHSDSVMPPPRGSHCLPKVERENTRLEHSKFNTQESKSIITSKAK